MGNGAEMSDIIRYRRTKNQFRDQGINSIGSLPAYYYAPPAKVSRWDPLISTIMETFSVFAIKPQDNRMTEEERFIVASIYKRIFGDRQSLDKSWWNLKYGKRP